MNRKDTPVELCGKDGVYRMLTTDHTTPMNFWSYPLIITGNFANFAFR